MARQRKVDEFQAFAAVRSTFYEFLRDSRQFMKHSRPKDAPRQRISRRRAKHEPVIPYFPSWTRVRFLPPFEIARRRKSRGIRILWPYFLGRKNSQPSAHANCVPHDDDVAARPSERTEVTIFYDEARGKRPRGATVSRGEPSRPGNATIRRKRSLVNDIPREKAFPVDPF